MEKRHRIFIAINLPEEVKRQLLKYQNYWPELPAKWTRPENLHITLEFLGDLTDQEIGEVCFLVKEISENFKSFSIKLEKVLYGPENKFPPRMVWVRGAKSKELADLKNNLQQNLLSKIRFKPDEKIFSPHITLARISEWQFKQMNPEEVPEIGEDVDIILPVESIEVMESELKRGGPQYTILEAHNLQI